MITFRCTKRVRDLLGLTDRDLDDESDGELYEWFVETATIDRYRCLLFTHKLSLYSFWALAVRKPDLLAFDELFQHHALAMLKGDGYTDVEIGRLLPRSGHRFAKTNSRPVTGSMNDHVKNSRWYFEHCRSPGTWGQGPMFSPGSWGHPIARVMGPGSRVT